MACDYTLSGGIQQDCVPSACGYNSAFFIMAWADYNAAVASGDITVTTSADFLAHTVAFKKSSTGSLKPLYSFDERRTAVFSGSTKAKADSPLSIPYFTKSLQLGVDKNAYMSGDTVGSTDSDGIAAASKLVNVLSAGRFVIIAERIDGKGFEAFGALSPLKCTAIDQSLASDDTNNGMITVTLECTEGDFSTAVANSATELAAYVKA